MKRFTDLDKNDFTCYMTKSELAKKVGCSANEVDKIKRSLKNAGLIEYECKDNKIVLIYEKKLEAANNNCVLEIKKAVRTKNKVKWNENDSTAF